MKRANGSMRHYMIKENISQANRQDRGLCPMLAGLRNPTWDKNEDFWSVPRYWGHALHLYVHSLAPNNHDRDKIISALSSSAFFFFFFPRKVSYNLQDSGKPNSATKMISGSQYASQMLPTQGKGWKSFRWGRHPFFSGIQISERRGHLKTSANFKLHAAGTPPGLRIWNSDKGKPA